MIVFYWSVMKRLHKSQPQLLLKNLFGFPAEIASIISRHFSNLDLDIFIKIASDEEFKEGIESDDVARLRGRQFIVSSNGGYKLASAHDFLGNFILFHRDSIDDKDVKLFDEYFAEEIFSHNVITYGRAREIVENAPGFYVLDCVCRVLNENCEHPKRVCMGLKKSYEFEGADNISKAEAHAIVAEAEESHLVPTYIESDNGEGWFCFCCGCCCIPIRQFLFDGQGTIANDVIEFTDNDLCSACGDCVDVCQFGARSLTNDEIQIDERLCLGCGVCVDVCSTEAISLIIREAV